MLDLNGIGARFPGLWCQSHWSVGCELECSFGRTVSGSAASSALRL